MSCNYRKPKQGELSGKTPNWRNRLCDSHYFVKSLIKVTLLEFSTRTESEKVKALVAQSCVTVCNPMDSTRQAPSPWDSPGKNTGVLQGIFLT